MPSPNAICDRCGSKYRLNQLRKEWTGFMVCHGPGTNDCWEPRHPQDFVRAIPDRQGIRPDMRPEPDDSEVYQPLMHEDGASPVLHEATPYPIIWEPT